MHDRSCIRCARDAREEEQAHTAPRRTPGADPRAPWRQAVRTCSAATLSFGGNDSSAISRRGSARSATQPPARPPPSPRAAAYSLSASAAPIARTSTACGSRTASPSVMMAVGGGAAAAVAAASGSGVASGAASGSSTTAAGGGEAAASGGPARGQSRRPPPCRASPAHAAAMRAVIRGRPELQVRARAAGEVAVREWVGGGRPEGSWAGRKLRKRRAGAGDGEAAVRGDLKAGQRCHRTAAQHRSDVAVSDRQDAVWLCGGREHARDELGAADARGADQAQLLQQRMAHRHGELARRAQVGRQCLVRCVAPHECSWRLRVCRRDRRGALVGHVDVEVVVARLLDGAPAPQHRMDRRARLSIPLCAHRQHGQARATVTRVVQPDGAHLDQGLDVAPTLRAHAIALAQPSRLCLAGERHKPAGVALRHNNGLAGERRIIGTLHRNVEVVNVDVHDAATRKHPDARGRQDARSLV
eukprot:6986788-Prymnesium_polylepis.1